MKKDETAEDVRKWFFEEVARLWPMAGGSLSLRKNSCIRPHCIACRTGEGHPAYALHFRKKGKASSVYVPDDLSEQMEQAVENGRKLKELLVEAGIRYLKASKAQRKGR